MSGPEPGISRQPVKPTPILAVLGFVIVIASAVLAIGTFRGSPAPSPVPDATSQPTVEVTPAPPLGLSADAYSCGGTPFIPGSTSTPAGAAPTGTTTAAASSSVAGPGEPSAALQALVARLPSILPATGWSPAGNAPGHLVYVAANNKTPAPFSFVDLAIVGSKWVAAGYGDCEPAAVAGSTLSPIPWTISAVDPAAPTLQILFRSNLCGQAFVGMTVWYGQSNVTVTLWARQATELQGGAGVCSSAAVTAPFTVSLAEPLGARQLRSGPASAAKPAATK
jgi:hypothetical protein